jgi:drug/metabolite transporter (DMT)-like permease
MGKAFLQLHLAIFLAGFTGILGKLITLEQYPLVLWRLTLSVILLWSLFLLKRKLILLNFALGLRSVGVGCIAALHWILFFGSIKYANVSVALVCFSSVGFFTAFLEPLINGKGWDLTDFVLGLLVIGGVAVIFHFDPHFQKGILYGLGSSFLGALFPIYNRRLMQFMNAPTLVTWELTGGWFFLLLFIPIYHYFFPAIRWIPQGNDLLWVFILASFCTVWAFQLSSNALKQLSAFTVNMSYNLEPVYGILLAFLVFGENKFLGASFYVGMAIILIALSFQTIRAIRLKQAA